MSRTATADQQTRILAAEYLGREISDAEYPSAKELAGRKLAWIIQREGDADGERRKPYYLAQLMAEAIRENAISAFTRELYNTIKYAEDNGEKRNARSKSRKANLNPYLYCITKF